MILERKWSVFIALYLIYWTGHELEFYMKQNGSFYNIFEVFSLHDIVTYRVYT